MQVAIGRAVTAGVVAAAMIRVAAIPVATAREEQAPGLAAVVARVDAYLVRYEEAVSTLVADETLRQQVEADGPLRVRREITSQVAFLRLPGAAEWFGHRDVRRVDGVAVQGPSLLEILTAAGADAGVRAGAIVEQSARYNLGIVRTINVPTLGLDLAHPRRRATFEVRDGGTTSIDGRRVRQIAYVERRPASIVTYGGAEYAASRVTLWAVDDDGTILRSLVRLTPPRRLPVDPVLRVDFAWDPGQQLHLPREMREEFSSGGQRATGRATYTNYRRFQTSGRLVPPGP